MAKAYVTVRGDASQVKHDLDSSKGPIEHSIQDLASHAEHALGGLMASVGVAIGFHELVNEFRNAAEEAGRTDLEFHKLGLTLSGELLEQAKESAEKLGTIFGGTATAARMLGRSLEHPGTGMYMLLRAGIHLNDQQKLLLKSFEELGDKESAQKMLMGILADKADDLTTPMMRVKHEVEKATIVMGNVWRPVLLEMEKAKVGFVQVGTVIAEIIAPFSKLTSELLQLPVLGKGIIGVGIAFGAAAAAMAAWTTASLVSGPVVEFLSVAASGLGKSIQWLVLVTKQQTVAQLFQTACFKAGAALQWMLAAATKGYGIALALLRGQITATTVATYAQAAAQATLDALMGPYGWMILAGAVAATGLAIGAMASGMGDVGSETEDASKDMGGLADETGRAADEQERLNKAKKPAPTKEEKKGLDTAVDVMKAKERELEEAKQKQQAVQRHERTWGEWWSGGLEGSENVDWGKQGWFGPSQDEWDAAREATKKNVERIKKEAEELKKGIAKQKFEMYGPEEWGGQSKLEKLKETVQDLREGTPDYKKEFRKFTETKGILPEGTSQEEVKKAIRSGTDLSTVGTLGKEENVNYLKGLEEYRALLKEQSALKEQKKFGTHEGFADYGKKLQEMILKTGTDAKMDTLIKIGEAGNKIQGLIEQHLSIVSKVDPGDVGQPPVGAIGN